MREAGGKTSRDRIRAERPPNNWDRPRGFVHDYCGFLSVGDDNVDRQPHQFASHRLQSAGIPGSEAVLDPDVLAVDIAEVAQAFAKRVEYLGRGPFGRRQDADAEHFPRLLGRGSQRRASHDRPER